MPSRDNGDHRPRDNHERIAEDDRASGSPAQSDTGRVRAANQCGDAGCGQRDSELESRQMQTEESE